MPFGNQMPGSSFGWGGSAGGGTGGGGKLGFASITPGIGPGIGFQGMPDNWNETPEEKRQKAFQFQMANVPFDYKRETFNKIFPLLSGAFGGMSGTGATQIG